MPQPTQSRPPKAFVSYSWDSPQHREWVRELATRLRTEGGVDVTLDQWATVPGHQLPHFMEKAVRENDFVVLICTPRYKAKMDGRDGGVGYEGDIMTGEAFVSGHPEKFIPVLRSGEWKEVGPSWVLGAYYIDLSAEPYAEGDYEALLRALHGERAVAPPIGPRPDFGSRQRPPQSSLTSVAELAVILEWVANLSRRFDNASYTFSEALRTLRVIQTVNSLLPRLLLRAKPHLPDLSHEAARALAANLRELAAEADSILSDAASAKERYLRERQRLKDVKWTVIDGWERLKPLLLWHPAVTREFDDTQAADVFVWKELGFGDRAAFDRFIHPRTKDWLTDGGALERELLRQIVEQNEASEAELLKEGYSQEAIIDAFNALLRDRYFDPKDSPTFRLSPVGRKMVLELLKQTSAQG